MVVLCIRHIYANADNVNSVGKMTKRNKHRLLIVVFSTKFYSEYLPPALYVSYGKIHHYSLYLIIMCHVTYLIFVCLFDACKNWRTTGFSVVSLNYFPCGSVEEMKLRWTKTLFHNFYIKRRTLCIKTVYSSMTVEMVRQSFSS